MKLSCTRVAITSGFQTVLLLLRNVISQNGDQLITQSGNTIVGNIQDL